MLDKDTTNVNTYSTGRYSQKKLPNDLMFIALRLVEL